MLPLNPYMSLCFSILKKFYFPVLYRDLSTNGLSTQRKTCRLGTAPARFGGVYGPSVNSPGFRAAGATRLGDLRYLSFTNSNSMVAMQGSGGDNRQNVAGPYEDHAVGFCARLSPHAPETVGKHGSSGSTSIFSNSYPCTLEPLETSNPTAPSSLTQNSQQSNLSLLHGLAGFLILPIRTGNSPTSSSTGGYYEMEGFCSSRLAR